MTIDTETKPLLLMMFILSALLLSVPTQARAESSAVDPAIRDKFEQQFSDVEITSIKQTPMPGIYQLAAGNEYIYITGNGRYLIQGDLIDMDKQWNLTEQERADWRKQLFESVDEKDMIVFAAEEEQHSIFVFTDIDCGYCRKLHEEIDTLNSQGVTVKYLAYPATGEYTKGWAQMAEVWCATDRQQALTDAKLGNRDGLAGDKSPEQVMDCAETIKQQYKMANTIDVIGTPAIYLESGDAIKGYLPPAKLVERIDSMTKNSQDIGYSM